MKLFSIAYINQKEKEDCIILHSVFDYADSRDECLGRLIMRTDITPPEYPKNVIIKEITKEMMEKVLEKDPLLSLAEEATGEKA